MTIAITAANGGLGAAVVREAVRQVGVASVIAVARTPDKVRAPAGVEVRAGDYDNRAQLTEAFTGVDTVLLVSSNAKPEDRPAQHGNVIEAAKAAGVRKLVYTGIAVLGESPITRVSKQTEDMLKSSGLAWVIGRNGLYIEPDLEYVDNYVKEGFTNCAGEGRCAYTSRDELAVAYVRLLTDAAHEGRTCNLAGPAITQAELADVINRVWGTDLVFRDVSPEEYEAERKAELGEFMGAVIATIYRTIREGGNDVPSDYEAVAGRPHKTPLEMARAFKKEVG